MKQDQTRQSTQTRTPTMRRVRTAIITALASAGIIAFVARLRR